MIPNNVDEHHWREAARCAQIGGDSWFPDNARTHREALAICGACPVRAQCLEYAIEHEMVHGIWGGTAPRERRQMRVDANRGASA
jgi:WhiB family redox-sensing transcriptional regulator